MTPTERIAVLFGWKPSSPHPHYEDIAPHWRWYRQVHPAEEQDPYAGAFAAIDSETDQVGFRRHGGWPDFTDEIKSHYWVRRMEERLREEMLFDLYKRALWDEWKNDGGRYTDYFPYLCTVEQRLAAAIAVLEQEGI